MRTAGDFNHGANSTAEIEKKESEEHLLKAGIKNDCCRAIDRFIILKWFNSSQELIDLG